jgi:hypothetical protein
MSEMIDKVAKAMWAAWLKESGVDESGAILASGADWKQYIPDAKTAIKAMREPTEEMIQAGINEGYKCGNWYPVMIDAALGEET